MADMRDLKKFQGNKSLPKGIMFLPVETRKYTVKDIPNLPADRVHVLGVYEQDNKIKPDRQARASTAYKVVPGK
jgi:hypothetical protein